MSKYFLFLYDDPTVWEKLSPEEMQKATEKYMAWGKKPYVMGGERLAQDPGRVLRLHDAKPRATDGPYSEGKEVLGGYYVIEAGSYDEAVERSLDNPHIQFGTVEIRNVFDKTGM